MDEPLVSIITPTYNHEKFIGPCLESVLAQTYQNWEQIIIDDGSTDKTAEVISRYEDPRIVYIRQEHQGPFALGATYNEALKRAKGDLIAILEGDDYWPADKLEKQVPYFEDEGIVLTYGRCAVVDPQGKIHHYFNLPRDRSIRDNDPVGSALKAFLKPINIAASQTVMIRRSALEHIGGFIQPEYLTLVDYPTYMRLSLEARFAGIPYVMGFWRRHARSVAFNYNMENWSGFIKYAQAFVAENWDRIRNLGLDLNLSSLREQHSRFIMDLRRAQKISRAKFYLDLGEFELARKEFRECLRAGDGFFATAAAWVGLASSHLHINLLEPVAKIRRWYKALIGEL